MNKKIIWGISTFFILAIIVWIAIPFGFQSNNLISRNNFEYSYKKAMVRDLDNLENSIIDNTEAGKVDKLISVIDELSLKKTWKPNDWSNYSLSFTATYKEGETSTYTKEVFFISFYKDKVIGFKRKPQEKETYYKIQNEEFDIKKVIEELQKWRWQSHQILEITKVKAKLKAAVCPDCGHVAFYIDEFKEFANG